MGEKISAFDVLIEVAMPEEEREAKADLLKAISYYQAAMKLLSLHRDLNDEEAETYQDQNDNFYSMWVDIFGNEGITNYIHMLG